MTSLLRELMNESALHGDLADAFRTLKEAALLVRKAGLEHLVTEATEVEVKALAEAGEIVAKEHAVLLTVSLMDPASAVAPFDGGALLRRSVMRAALAASQGGG